MADSKPRIFQDSRDILLSMVVIFVIMFASVGMTGLCHFHPGPPGNGPIQAVDSKTMLGFEARSVDWPVRYPETPGGWTCNSARRTMLAGDQANVVGFVTARGTFVELYQTAAEQKKAVDDVDEVPRVEEGTTSVSGLTWKKLVPDHTRGDKVWVTRIDKQGVTLLLRGTADDEDFATIAANAAEGEILPHTVAPIAPATSTQETETN